MRRLFRKWDASNQKSLTLQNVVVGLAHVKGSRDIMANIAYFFEMFDDDGDGKIDRDGILKMSESLLFLGRRGIETAPEISPRRSTDLGGASEQLPGASKDEQFLGAVSSFIRRCFEYADPDRDVSVEEVSGAVDDFGIGDDEDDLMDMGPLSPKSPKSPKSPRTSHGQKLNLPPMPSETKPHSHAANIALDPANPLFITLPTFRMLILADEILEHFFDTVFPQSFHLADVPTSSTSASASLTTFSNIGRVMPSGSASVPGAGGVVPPSKGIRGMLDNIVTDGMRVATEVRKRMEEAGRELDRASGFAPEEDDEENEDAGHTSTGGLDGRSIREGDHDLLEGAELAEIGDSAGGSGKGQSLLDLSSAEKSDSLGRLRKTSEAAAKRESVVEFEQ